MKVLAALVLLALCAAAVADPPAATPGAPAAAAPNPLNAIVGAAKNVAGAIGNGVNAVVNGAKNFFVAPEAAALTAAKNNVVGVINCAIKTAGGAGKGAPQKAKLPQKPKAPAGAPTPLGVPSAPAPSIPQAGGYGAVALLEESDPALAAAGGAPAPENLVAPVAPGLAGGAPTAVPNGPAPDGNGAAVAPGAPTSSALAAFMAAQAGGAVTSENIVNLCTGAAGGGAQKGKKAQAQKQKAKLLAPNASPAAPNAAPSAVPPKIPQAGGYALLQLRSLFRQPPAAAAAAAPGPVAVKAQAPKTAQGAQKPLAKEGDPMNGALKAACVMFAKLGADILNTCPAAASDNSDVDISPLLAALGNNDDPNAAPASPGLDKLKLLNDGGILPGAAPPATVPVF